MKVSWKTVLGTIIFLIIAFFLVMFIYKYVKTLLGA